MTTTTTMTAVDVDDVKDVMSRCPTGVAVVTAVGGGGPVRFTCQSLVSLSLDPVVKIARSETPPLLFYRSQFARLRAAL